MLSQTYSLYFIYLLITLYALCYQFQTPLEPFLVDKLVTVDGKDSDAAVEYGRVKSLFAFAQCIGSLMFGYLLDKFGIRVGFVINFLACSLSYYLLSIADTMDMLVLSKLPGIAMAGFLCGQAAVVKVTPEGPERVKALGRLTSAYTVGGVVGPYLGGLLGSTGDYYYGARLATTGMLATAVLVLLVPWDLSGPSDRESTSVDKKQKSDSVASEAKQESWYKRLASVLRLVGFLLFVKIATSIANSLTRSSQPLIMKNELLFDEAMLGLFMSSQFAFGGFANAFLLGPVTSLMGGEVHLVVRNCIMLMSMLYLSLAAMFSVDSDLLSGNARQMVFIVITMVLAVFQYGLGTSITAETSSLIPKDIQGTLIGLEHSLFAVAYVIGPALGTYIYSQGGIAYVTGATGLTFLGVFVIWVLSGRSMLENSHDSSSKHAKQL